MRIDDGPALALQRIENESFEFVDAVRGKQAVIIGIEGPPGGGKTVSAVRLALGAQRIRGGPVCFIDTDNDRGRKIADKYQFKHMSLRPPFQSERLLRAAIAASALKPSAIIIDVMSTEHNGRGGYMDYHEGLLLRAIERDRGDDPEWIKRERHQWRCWAEPKAHREAMVEGFLQLPDKQLLILTFRAEEKTALVEQKGKRARIESVGYKPIAPKKIVENCDLFALLPANAQGVARWTSDKEEGYALKLPYYAAKAFEMPGPLNEDMGEAIARWARGDAVEEIEAWVETLAQTRSPLAGAPAGGVADADLGRDAAPSSDAFVFKLQDSNGRVLEFQDAARWVTQAKTWIAKCDSPKLEEFQKLNNDFIEEARTAQYDVSARLITDALAERERSFV